MKDELEDLAREFLETMIRVNSRFREERLWRGDELSLPQFMLLHHLHRHGPARSGEVARNLRVSQGVVTRMVDRLVEKGLVARSRDPDDRRVVLLSPTARGKRLVKGMEKQKLREIKAFLRSIPPREKSDLLDLFRRIKEFLERESWRDVK